MGRRMDMWRRRCNFRQSFGAFQAKQDCDDSRKNETDRPLCFFDEDGKIYLYHVRLLNGNRIFVAEMNKNLNSKKEKNRKRMCFRRERMGGHCQCNMESLRRSNCYQIGQNSLYVLFLQRLSQPELCSRHGNIRLSHESLEEIRSSNYQPEVNRIQRHRTWSSL